MNFFRNFADISLCFFQKAFGFTPTIVAAALHRLPSRIPPFITIASVFLLMMAGNARGQSGTYNGFKWSASGNSITITGYSGSGPGGNVVIPSSISNLTVTAIAGYAFSGNNTITAITIPGVIKSIGQGAFYDCTELSSAVLSNGIPALANSMFMSCSNISSVTIPASVTSVGNSAFQSCTSLQSIILPNGVTNIGGSAFLSCNILNRVTILDSITTVGGSVGDYAFASCTNLASVTVPNSVTSLGQYAFYLCKSLTNVMIPGQVATIGASAFLQSGLKSIILPASIVSLGQFSLASSSLTNACFEGNAPPNEYGVEIFGVPTTKVYYVEGATGWQSPYFGGFATQPCVQCGPALATMTIAPLRVAQSQADLSVKPTNLSTPIVPLANTGALGTGQVQLGLGVVADGVTPVLFMIQGTPGTYTLNLSTTDASSSATVAYAGGSLARDFYVLGSSGWTNSTTITIPSGAGATGTNYVFLQGMTWSSFSGVTPPANQVNVTLIISTAIAAQQVTATNFAIRPPPVVLVHGIADSGATWSYGFTNALAQYVPEDFIIPISYGQGTPGTPPSTWPCSTSQFVALAPQVDSILHGVESQLRLSWDYTRYDAVGHSQGGVLLRMLCQTAGPNGFGPFTSDLSPVVSANNIYRGRFRRVVTIGSPHNGSLISYYINKMSQSSFWWVLDHPWFGSFVPVFTGPVVDKFNPDGDQIRVINNPELPVSSSIPFHCIATTINSGSSPGSYEPGNPAVYNLLELQYVISFGIYSGSTRGQVLIPFGSDGIVDLVSAKGGPGTSASYDFASVSHCKPEWAFLVPNNNTQTGSAAVGTNLTALLNGPASNFGPFQLPPIITDQEKTLYNTIIPGSIFEFPAIAQGPSPHYPSTNINYIFNIPTNLPVQGTIFWQAVAFGTNGITTNGLSLNVNSNNSAAMTLTIDASVVGQVYISADYNTTNGSLVFASPFLAVSRAPSSAAIITNIQFSPQSMSLPVGDSFLPQIVGSYSDGSQLPLCSSSPGMIYFTSNPQVVKMDTNGNVTLLSEGAAQILAEYNGLTAQGVVSAIGAANIEILFFNKTNGHCGFSILGASGITNIVETSTNLINWFALTTLVPTNAFIQFNDPNTINNPRMFYRVVAPAVDSGANSPPISPQILAGVESNSVFSFLILGGPGMTNIVQVSSNLVNWTTLASFPPTNGVLQFSDLGANKPSRRFYRVMVQ